MLDCVHSYPRFHVSCRQIGQDSEPTVIPMTGSCFYFSMMKLSEIVTLLGDTHMPFDLWRPVSPWTLFHNGNMANENGSFSQCVSVIPVESLQLPRRFSILQFHLFCSSQLLSTWEESPGEEAIFWWIWITHTAPAILGPSRISSPRALPPLLRRK